MLPKLTTTREVTYQDENLNVRLTVRPANVQVGMYRTMLRQQAIEAENAAGTVQPDDLPGLARRIMHTMVYPSLIAATVEQEGFDHWPLTFEAFYDLPEGLEARWEEAVSALNPHWFALELPQEKKA